jgi:hypothetical protein
MILPGGHLMQHRWLAAIAVAATGVGLFALAPAATAASAAPIRSYHEAVNFNLDGYGTLAGWFYHYVGSEQVTLSPHLAYFSTFHNSGFGNNDKPMATIEQQYLVNGVTYTKKNGGSWSESKQTAADLSSDAYSLDSSKGAAMVEAIPGAALIGAGHYQAEATVQQANNFLTFEYGLTEKDLSNGDIKTITINAWVDAEGRPLKYVITAHGQNESIDVVETFGDYNARLTIKAP